MSQKSDLKTIGKNRSRKSGFRKTGALLMAVLMSLLVFTGCSKKTESTSDSALRHVKITVQDYGDIVLELHPEIAPITVENFIHLAEEGFYDGLTFHRIMDGFMIQGGDPQGDGYGGSDETIIGEFELNGHPNSISHEVGVISMARSRHNDSASSQFFITVGDATHLDGAYAAFGYVTEGLDVALSIARDARPIDNNGTIPKSEQPVMLKVEVLD